MMVSNAVGFRVVARFVGLSYAAAFSPLAGSAENEAVNVVFELSRNS